MSIKLKDTIYDLINNSDKLDGNHGSWYQNNVVSFARVGYTATQQYDANIGTSGMMYNYGSSSYWRNAPSMLFGQILTLQSGTLALAGQLAWDVTHASTTDTTRFLWWRATDAGDWVEAKWHQIAFTDSNVASATKLQTAHTIWGQSFDGTGNIASTLPIIVNQMKHSSDYHVIGSDASGNITIGSSDVLHSTTINSKSYQVLTLKSTQSNESSINYTNIYGTSWVAGINPGHPNDNTDFWSIWSNTSQKLIHCLDSAGTAHFYFNSSIANSYNEGIRVYGATKTSSWSEINFGCDPSVTYGTHSTQWTIGRNANNAFVIRNYDKDRLVITTDGLTGIGTLTASPLYTLHVNGSFYASSGSFGGTSKYANLLSNQGGTSTDVSSWNPKTSYTKVWGQRFSNSSISSDTGDIVYYLRSSTYSTGGTEFCLVIDGDYYAGTGQYKVIHEGNISSYIPSPSTNADTVDGYHASSLWRSDGGVWNPLANITLGATANNQDWSFDITRNGHTGCYWHVWDSSLGTCLKVEADSGKVTAAYAFNCTTLQIGGETITFTT